MPIEEKKKRQQKVKFLKEKENIELNLPETKIQKEFTKPSNLKVALFWICGIESNLKENFNPNENVENIIDTSIDQDPFWSKVCDLNAVIAIALCGFSVAFFNKYN